MRLSKFNMKKINLNDIDKDYSGQDILMKIGELYQFESGIYGYGNIWSKLENNIKNIIIENLDKADCIQVEFPKLQPKKIWEQSDRWNQYTKETDMMFTLKNNLGEYGLAPTAEECATIFGASRLLSYKQMPATYYQINEKFRKEKRARGYLFRPRTFVMMDAYSFDKDEKSMHETFKKMHQVYINIFKEIGLDIIPVISDGGTMGGRISEEFQVKTKLGEDIILYDKKNNIGINKEVLTFKDKETFIKELGSSKLEEMEEINSVEIGNNFELGTKYSKAMKLYYQDENGQQKPYYMGCYGIGVGRVLACLIENNIIIKDGKIKGFVLPYSIAPYKVHIIYTENNKEEAKKIYNQLLENKIPAIIDDRQDLSLGNRINDVSLLGTPKMIILGNKYSGKQIEIENIQNHQVDTINKENLLDYFNKIK